jgi:hypothetical protein
MSGYRATPEEIGRMRREIREALAYSKKHNAVPAQPFMKAGTLDAQSWTWLRQRMRPQELALLDSMCPTRASLARNDMT